MIRIVREMNELKVKNALRIHELIARLVAMEKLEVCVNRQKINLEEETEAKLAEKENLIRQQQKQLENLKLMNARTNLELERLNEAVVDEENGSHEAVVELLSNGLEEMKSKANGLDEKLKESKKVIMNFRR